MSAKILDGKKLSLEWLEEIKSELNESRLKPVIALVLVGEDAASRLYVKKKETASREVGVEVKKFELKEDIEEEELLNLIEELNLDEKINGIMVEFPLPKQVDPLKVMEKIAAEKDVDGLHPLNQGKNLIGEPVLQACTARGVMRLLKETRIELKGKNVAMVGTSNIVGKPLGAMLLNSGASVSYCNKETKDISFYTRNADILIVAAGKPNLITREMVKPGAVVIDVGINKLQGKVVGDVDFENVKEVASFITPVPGGVGPMTVASLLENLLIAAKMQRGKE